MSKRILEKMRETKITDIELNWLYVGLVKKEVIDPSDTMIHRWTCEAVFGSLLRYWFGWQPHYDSSCIKAKY
jgi:hypothetical protein